MGPKNLITRNQPRGPIPCPVKPDGTNIFKSAEDIAEAVSVAKQVRDCQADEIELDEREMSVLKQALNRLVELTAEGKANLGGEIHEEAIVRIIKAEEVK